MIGTLDTSRKSATVVGAGMSGLLAAYQLDKAGYEVTLIEASARAGGLVETVETPYGIAERAANSFLASPPVLELCSDLRVELTPVRNKARLILRKRRFKRFPLTPSETLRMIRKAIREPAPTPATDLTLDQWTKRHLGDAALEFLIRPFVTGIYAADPAEIGVHEAFPSLVVPPGQTLLRALRSKRKDRAKEGAEPKRTRSPMMAPLHGMGTLANRLAIRLQDRLGSRFKLGTPLESLADLKDEPNVILTVPAAEASRLLESESPELSHALSRLNYSPLVSATVFYKKEHIGRPRQGVGALIPPSEGRPILGVLFSSSSFEGRVASPQDCVSMTVMIGGTRQPQWIEASEVDLRRMVSSQLSDLFGIQEEPLHIEISRWPRAIPVYSPGISTLWQLARRTWCHSAGHILFGNYTGQVSLRGMIETVAKIGYKMPSGELAL